MSLDISRDNFFPSPTYCISFVKIRHKSWSYTGRPGFLCMEYHIPGSMLRKGIRPQKPSASCKVLQNTRGEYRLTFQNSWIHLNNRQIMGKKRAGYLKR